MDVLSTKTIELEGFTVRIDRVLDTDPDLSYLEQSYEPDCPPDEAEKYRKQDSERLRDYNRGEWQMIGICATVVIDNGGGWAKPTEIGRDSLWGIESDSDEGYLGETERECARQAISDTRKTYKAMERVMGVKD